jgi:hypothetical protein
VIEKRVTVGKHEAVEIAVAREAHQDPGVVHADTEGLDHALAAQLRECAVRATHRLVVTRFELVALPTPVDVVNEDDVDASRVETQEAVLQRTHRFAS